MLWHADLIELLPTKELLITWRECQQLYSKIKEDEELQAPHKWVLEHPATHLFAYSMSIFNTLQERRGYDKERSESAEYILQCYINTEKKFKDDNIPTSILFPYWHTGRYLRQCFYILEMKYDNLMLTPYEWNRIKNSEVIAKSGILKEDY